MSQSNIKTRLIEMGLRYAARPMLWKFHLGCLVGLGLSVGIYNYEEDAMATEEAREVVSIMMHMVVNIQSQASMSDTGSIDLNDIDPNKVMKYIFIKGKAVTHTGWDLASPFGYGPIRIQPTIAYNGNRPALAIEVTGMPKRACQYIVQRDFGPSILDATSYSGVHVASRPMTAAEAKLACPQIVNLVWWAVNLTGQ